MLKMEKRASLTETSRNILPSSLKHCPSNELLIVTNQPSTEDSMVKTPNYQPTVPHEATLTLDCQSLQLLQPETRQPYSKKGEWLNKGATPNEPCMSFITEATVTAPPTVFPLFANFETGENYLSDTEEIDDQAEHSDPFEYDNAPKYRAVLGTCSRDIAAPKSSIISGHVDEGSDRDTTIARKKG